MERGIWLRIRRIGFNEGGGCEGGGGKGEKGEVERV